MAGLDELTLKTAYHKGQDNIADQFYLPCMRKATSYDRAVGFFRSTAFIVAWPALREFVRREGRIRVLCSQVMATDDVAALERGYDARTDAALAIRLREEVHDLLADEQLRAPARILAALVARGTLELKVAILTDTQLRAVQGRIFHDKLGIFRDTAGNVVTFKGSMNETWMGLAADGNLESVDVAVSWLGDRDLERTQTNERYFDALWSNTYPRLSVRAFPEVAREEFVRSADADWEDALDRLLASTKNSTTKDAKGRTLLPHQATGLASWRANDRRGILAFATGAGKTFTAVQAIREAIRDRNEVPVVVVPDTALFAQWYSELQATLADLNVQILRAGSGHQLWRDYLRSWSRPEDVAKLVLATVQTASSTEFRERMAGGKHLFLVADEVHRLGSPHYQQLLDEQLFGPRLGLSATPERAGDPSGTQRIMDFFGGILEPRYTLSDAVRDGVLCKYFYRSHPVSLSAQEAQDWRAISADVSKMYARIASGDQSPGLRDRLRNLLIRRAKIVKQAEGKIPLAVSVVRHEFADGQRWIVYCDELPQLQRVVRELKQVGVTCFPYHSAMDGDRAETLKWLDRRGGVVVAIKCLDEGVDIPSVSHALILASSKNPREFIQRRGRVLRRSQSKALAYIHDAIVVPSVADAKSGQPDPITAGEIARALEFATHADNPGAGSDLKQLAIDHGIDLQNWTSKGVEDEEG